MLHACQWHRTCRYSSDNLDKFGGFVVVCVCGVQIAFWYGFWWCFDCNVGLGEQSVHVTSHLFL